MLPRLPRTPSELVQQVPTLRPGVDSAGVSGAQTCVSNRSPGGADAATLPATLGAAPKQAVLVSRTEAVAGGGILKWLARKAMRLAGLSKGVWEQRGESLSPGPGGRRPGRRGRTSRYCGAETSEGRETRRTMSEGAAESSVMAESHGGQSDCDVLCDSFFVQK